MAYKKMRTSRWHVSCRGNQQSFYHWRLHVYLLISFHLHLIDPQSTSCVFQHSFIFVRTVKKALFDVKTITHHPEPGHHVSPARAGRKSYLKRWGGRSGRSGKRGNPSRNPSKPVQGHMFRDLENMLMHIGNGHWNSEFSHLKKCDFPSYVNLQEGIKAVGSQALKVDQQHMHSTWQAAYCRPQAWNSFLRHHQRHTTPLAKKALEIVGTQEPAIHNMFCKIITCIRF